MMLVSDLPPNPTFYNMYAHDFIKAKYAGATVEKILGKLKGIRSVYDLGCGTGLIVKEFRDRDIHAWGFDNNDKELCSCNIMPEFTRYEDLRLPLYDKYRPVDLVYSVEVAEHIEPQYTDVYFDNVVKMSRAWIFLTGSNKKHSPGHVNPRPNIYWQEKVTERGLHLYRGDLSAMFRDYFKRLIAGGALKWFQKNVMIFERIKESDNVAPGS